MAREFIADVDLPEATRASCVKLCVQFHQSTDDLAVRFHQELRRRYYVTPSSYLELITAFKSLLAERRRQIVSTKQRYEGGLQVLATTASQVKNMLQELEELRPVLIRTGVETDEMIVQVDKETRDAEQIRSLVKQEEIVANEKASAAKQIADECGADLAQAMPILEAAIAALNTLTKNDLVEVKAMKSPPAGVLVVMEAVCVMMNIPPTRSPDSTGKMVKDYWDPAKKKLLSDPKLLTTLSSYDKDNIPRDIIKKIATYIDNPLFDPASVKKASKAAFGLCSWVRAMYQYDEVANAIRPKRERLEQAKAEYAVVEKVTRRECRGGRGRFKQGGVVGVAGEAGRAEHSGDEAGRSELDAVEDAAEEERPGGAGRPVREEAGPGAAADRRPGRREGQVDGRRPCTGRPVREPDRRHHPVGGRHRLSGRFHRRLPIIVHRGVGERVPVPGPHLR